MYIYLAARYSRQEEMLAISKRLEELGHTVTARWVQGNHQALDATLLEDPSLASRFAWEDIEDLMRADTFILFTDPLRTPTRGGKQVELGIVLGISIAGGWTYNRIITVGQPENVFQCLPQIIHVPDTEALFAFLEPFHA